MPRGRRGCEPTQHLSTYLVTRAANTYSTMHYNVGRWHERLAPHHIDAPLQDPARRAPPAGVQQRHDVFVRHDEIGRNAIGDRDGEEHSAGPRSVPVHAVEDEPAFLPLAVPLHGRSVDLVAEQHGGETGAKGGAEGPPAGHDLPDVLLAPQPEGKRAPAGRDARDDPIAFRPFAERHARDGGVGDGLLAQRRPVGHSHSRTEFPARIRSGQSPGIGRHGPTVRRSDCPSILSICAPSARSRAPTGSYPRSTWPMLWITEAR